MTLATDPNASATIHGAWSWSIQNRTDEMNACIAKLPRDQVLEALAAARVLSNALLERSAFLADEALDDLGRARVAFAVLSPDDPGLPGGES